jgi:predicted amidophosphoribosyltransferase
MRTHLVTCSMCNKPNSARRDVGTCSGCSKEADRVARTYIQDWFSDTEVTEEGSLLGKERPLRYYISQGE